MACLVLLSQHVDPVAENISDTNGVPEVAPHPDEPYYGDAGYVSAERKERLRERGYDPQICERIPKNRPLLIPEVKEENR